MWDLDDLIDSGNFSVRSYLPLIGMDSSTHMHALWVYVNEGLPFSWELSLENSADSYVFTCLYFTQWLTSFSSIVHLFCLCARFLILISSNIDEVLSINPSAYVFVFGDFHVHHKNWLTYSGGTDWSGKLCYNFSISKNLTQMVNFSTQIPDCDAHSPALLELFLSPYASICSAMAWPPLGNSHHIIVSGSFEFPSNS